MSADVRADAEARARKALRTPDLEWAQDLVHGLAQDVLALLSRLASAERERDEAREAFRMLEAVGYREIERAQVAEARLRAAEEALRAARELHDFLWNERETFDPGDEWKGQGFVAAETSADYDRLERLTVALGAALPGVQAAAEEQG